MITKVEAATDQKTIDLDNTQNDTWEGDIEKNEKEIYPVTVTAYSSSGNSASIEKIFNFSTGYTSNEISDENGEFEKNPVVSFSFETRYKCFGINIKFSGNLPKKFIIHTYVENESVEDITVEENIVQKFELLYEFQEFDKMDIEFIETQVPYNRILIDYISFGAETDYIVRYDDLYSTPTGIQLEKVKNLNVSRQIYSLGAENEELVNDKLNYDGMNHTYYFNEPCYGYIVNITNGMGAVSVAKSGAYFIELQFSGVELNSEIEFTVTGKKYNISESIYIIGINNKGNDSEWRNPLISEYEHCKDVAEWVSDYFSSGIEYELDFRGDPALDCGDTIFQENKYVENLKVIIEEQQITFNGALRGALRTWRKEHVARTENGLASRRLR